MTPFDFMIILISVILNACAQILLKIGASALKSGDFSNGPMQIVKNACFEYHIWGGLLCYGFSIIVWIYALSRVDVSTAYPLLSIGFILSAMAAWLFLNEPIGISKISGILLITIGVILISANK